MNHCRHSSSRHAGSEGREAGRHQGRGGRRRRNRKRKEEEEAEGGRGVEETERVVRRRETGSTFFRLLVFQLPKVFSPYWVGRMAVS